MNKLYYGDNLDILRQYLAAESVDLVYLDPPFNSKRGYNLLFKTPKGHDSDAQVTAFLQSTQDRIPVDDIVTAAAQRPIDKPLPLLV